MATYPGGIYTETDVAAGEKLGTSTPTHRPRYNALKNEVTAIETEGGINPHVIDDTVTVTATPATIKEKTDVLARRITDLIGSFTGVVSLNQATLVAKFDATTGHAHDGSAGDGGNVSHADLSDLATGNPHPQYALAGGGGGGTGMTNPMTTQDDLIVGGAAGVPSRLGKGTDGQALVIDPTTHHLAWATPTTGGGGGGTTGLVDPTTTKGDLIVRPAQGTDRALGVIATSNEGTTTSFANLTDGNDATRFDGNAVAIPSSYFLFDLGAAYSINQWRIRQMAPTDQWFATQYKWQYSDDNVTFTDADTHNAVLQDETVNMATAHTARYWKLVLLASVNPAAAWLAYTVSLFQAVAPTRLPVGTSGQMLSANPAQPLGVEWVTPVTGGGGGGGGGGSGLYDAYVHVRDERASGTHGGDYTTASTWQTRPLQVEKDDPSNIAALASNQITLPAGTYRVQARGVTQFTGPARLRLRDVTNGATLVLGVTAGDNVGGGGYTQSDPLELSGRFTLAGTAAIELQMWATYARATYGFGAAAGTGDVEVYATVELWREGAGGGGGSGPAYATPGSMTGWAWDVQGGSTITANANAWDMTTDTADNAIHLFYKAYPTPPFTMIVGIKPPLVVANYNAAGLAFQQGAAGPMYAFYVDNDGADWYIRVDQWDSPSGFHARQFSRICSLRDVMLFKLEDDGTNTKFSVAHDLDYQWQQVYLDARTAWVAAANRLGVMMQASTAQAARSRLMHLVFA